MVDVQEMLDENVFRELAKANYPFLRSVRS